MRGELQPVMTDWDSKDSPPFSALVRPDARRDGVTQDFVAFLGRLLGGIEAQCNTLIGPRPSPERPHRVWEKVPASEPQA